MPGRKNQGVVLTVEQGKAFFRYSGASGVVTLDPHLEYVTKWALAANEAADPNGSAPSDGRVVQCEIEGITRVCLTPYWPAATQAVSGVVWLKQADEPDATKRWRPVISVTFTPGSVLRQEFNTGGHDLMFQPVSGVDAGHTVEIHVDAA